MIRKSFKLSKRSFKWSRDYTSYQNIIYTQLFFFHPQSPQFSQSAFFNVRFTERDSVTSLIIFGKDFVLALVPIFVFTLKWFCSHHCFCSYCEMILFLFLFFVADSVSSRSSTNRSTWLTHNNQVWPFSSNYSLSSFKPFP